MKTEHILIIRLSALGDVAMTVPVVYSLATQYPHAHITVLSRPVAHAFYDNLAPNVGFMEVTDEELGSLHGLNKLYRRLVAKQFTAVADLHDVLRTKYLRLRFSMGGFHVAHIDKHRKGKRLMVRPSNKIIEQQPTSFQNYADVLAKLGYPVKLSFTSIYSPANTPTAEIEEKIGPKSADERWIGIAPFSAHQGKIYPIGQMKHVVSQLLDGHPKYRIFLFGGGKRETQEITHIAKRSSQCTVASTVVKGLQEELVLINRLDVMVSMDSANMHLASLVNTPVVSIWGATHPYAGFMGWGHTLENAVQLDMHCRPCSIYGNKPCMYGTYACMKNIPATTIARRIEAVIAHNDKK